MKAPIILVALTVAAFGQEPAPSAPAPEPTSQPFLGTPQVRVDVLMVEVAEPAALKLLPDLRDAKKIDAAQATILEMVAKQQAKLIDWSELTTHSGVRTVSESIVEQRFPVEFSLGQSAAAGGITEDKKSANPGPNNLSCGIIPSTFESRNAGVTHEIDPTVSPDGKAVTFLIRPQIVMLEEMRVFPAGVDSKGEKQTVDQPIFTTRTLTTTVTLRDGERRLIYSGKLQKPDTAMTLFIVGAQVIPAGK